MRNFLRSLVALALILATTGTARALPLHNIGKSHDFTCTVTTTDDTPTACADIEVLPGTVVGLRITALAKQVAGATLDGLDGCWAKKAGAVTNIDGTVNWNLTDGNTACRGNTSINEPDVSAAGNVLTVLVTGDPARTLSWQVRVRLYPVTATPLPLLELGEASITGANCASGFGADGVCCNNACDQTCKSCIASETGGVDGTCTFTTAGSPCSVNGGTECDGAENCVTTSTTTTTTSTTTTTTLQVQGGACTMDSDCNAQFCVDGVCCNTTCTGTCRSCLAADTGGSNGTCDDISADTDPHNECTGRIFCSGSTGCSLCGNNDLDPGEQCDGGQFNYYENNTACCNQDCTFTTAGSPCSVNGGTECDGAENCVTTSTTTTTTSTTTTTT